jgi:flavodoxin
MSKVLVAYFSYSGTTKKVAEQVAQTLGADEFEIVPVEPYDKDYQACVDKARTEVASGARPAVADKLEGVAEYDKIVVAFPNWCRTCPMVVLTFLESYDFSGKKIYAIVTNGGGGVGNSAEDIAKSCKGATVVGAIDGNKLTESDITNFVV